MPDTTHTHGARDSHLTEATHPLDALTPGEIDRVRAALDTAGELQSDTRFPLQVLLDPPKAQLAAWQPGQPLGRRVQTTLLDTATGRVREATVALDDMRVEAVETLPTAEAPYGQPPYLFEEYEVVDRVVKADAGWREAMEARGLTEWERALVVPLAPGQFGEADEVGKRMMRSLTFMSPAEGDNPWSFPVEGLVLMVNVTEQRVVKLIDERHVPIPVLEGANYDDAAVGERRTSLKPLEITMPEGPSFSVDGGEVTWEQWRFRVGFSMREGLVLHQLGWQDGDELRPVLHRASVPEMVVPYGDTSESRRWISYFDAGEYNLGKNANSLQLGCDCLGAIHYFDAHVAADTGEAITIPRAICMHEEDDGVLWKHRELDGETTHGRRSRRLVISYWATVGNYDYGFFWYLYLDGSIQFEAKATGIVFAGADEPGSIQPHATEMAPGLFAPIHQHIFCARLDFDIDGTDNYVDQVDLVRMPMGAVNPWGNAFGYRRDRVAEASGLLGDGALGRTWHVGSSSRTNAVGRPTEFQLIPEARATLMADPDATVSARAAFATKHLWVTAHRDDDIYPAGRYPNQHSGGAGLPASVEAGGAVDGDDLVVWHAFGLTHIPRPEDWPIMPVDAAGFWVKPYGFLDRNPALDVPEAGRGCGCAGDSCTCGHDRGHDGHSGHRAEQGHDGHDGDDGDDHVAVR
ncbi:primary-amine oxidase [Agrococcus sp. ARC_14]|uniref:primary-amine oxidase n=1 Tax=Agrococcus sp. ARC_14 TaxID=2919927 RepID=UPI001F06BBA5|nr:primary-amine oxidase [Agrococcus sp. ARC_14]MCH1882487.1 primary-amine oxidase [Agrococcus sp. ARC_14]